MVREAQRDGNAVAIMTIEEAVAIIEVELDRRRWWPWWWWHTP